MRNMPTKRRPRKGTLHHALDACDPDELKKVVSQRCDLDIKAVEEIMKCVKKSREFCGDQMSPLQAAICLGDFNVSKLLIEEGAALKSGALSFTPHPLSLALQRGQFDIARLLIKAGADLRLKFDDALPMCFALENSACNVQIVKDIIDAGFDPNETIDFVNGLSTLHIAVYNSCTSVVKYLLSIESINVNKVDKKGLSALHYAIHKNNLKMMKLLVRKGGNVNSERLANGSTPLLYAIDRGTYEMVELLISLGADVHHVSTNKKNTMMPLHYAAGLCKFKIVQLLVEKGADVNRIVPLTGESALHMACKANHKTIPMNKVALDCIVEFLIKEGACLETKNELGSTPLQLAIASRNSSLAKILIMSGSKINSGDEKSNETILHLVSKGIDKDLIQFCLEYGGDYMALNKVGMYPCSLIVFRSFLEHMNQLLSERQEPSDLLHLLKLFWKHGFPYDQIFPAKWMEKHPLINPPKVATIMHKQKMLFKGVKKCDLGLVQKAIVSGAEVNCCSQSMQPLHYLALKGSVDIMKEFVSRGVIVNHLNADGMTPLHIAAEYGHLDCCKFLLENGAVYNWRESTTDLSPEDCADFNCEIEVVKLFTKVDKLFRAAKKGNINELSRNLTTLQIAMNCRHRDGKTLLGRAIHFNNKDCADFLMKHRLKMAT